MVTLKTQSRHSLGRRHGLKRFSPFGSHTYPRQLTGGYVERIAIKRVGSFCHGSSLDNAVKGEEYDKTRAKAD
jgi:hypothetical protein